MTGAPVPVRVLCARTIANVSPGLSRALSLDPGQNSIALLATDCDDVTYLALDEATKAANVSVVYGRSLYAGAGNAPTPLTGEVIGLLAGPTPADARSGLAAALAPEHVPEPEQLKAEILSIYAKFNLFDGTVHQRAALHLHLDGSMLPETAWELALARGIPLPADTLEEFRAAIGPETKAVVCTHVSNVFGYVLPIEKIAALCFERGVPLVVDCSQSAGILPVSLGKLHAAFLCMPGHKSLYGPQGTGVLVCGHALRPLLAGGTGSLSERAQMPEFTPDAGEAGTHNVPGICALHEGVRFVRSVGLSQIAAHEKMLAQLLIAELEAMPGVRVFHGAAQTGVVSFLLEREDVEKTAARLSRQGFALRAGLHCAPLAHESAGTLQSGTVRAGFSVFNTAREVRELVRVLSC